MGQLIWQIKQLLSKVIVYVAAGAILYGGYSLYRQGAFRGGVAHASKVILRQVPYFGSRFRHYFSSAKRGYFHHGSIARSGRGHRRHFGGHRRSRRFRR